MYNYSCEWLNECWPVHHEKSPCTWYLISVPASSSKGLIQHVDIMKIHGLSILDCLRSMGCMTYSSNQRCDVFGFMLFWLLSTSYNLHIRLQSNQRKSIFVQWELNFCKSIPNYDHWTDKWLQRAQRTEMFPRLWTVDIWGFIRVQLSVLSHRPRKEYSKYEALRLIKTRILQKKEVNESM